MKKFVSLLLAIALILSVNSALAFDWLPETDESQYDWLLDTSPLDVEIYYSNSGVADPDALSLDKIEKATGIRIQPTVSGDTDGTGLMLLLASNSMPDVVVLRAQWAWTPSFMEQAIASDSLWAIDDLLQYAPHLKELVPEYEFTDFQWTDGKTYQLTTQIPADKYLYEAMLEYGALNQQNATLIRKDWYEEAGSPDMTTPDSFIATIKTIMEKHPDAYGWVTPDLRNSYAYNEFKEQFGAKPYYVKEDGTVTNQAFSPECREAALFLNRLYREGILRKDNMIEGGDECQSYVYAGKTVSYRWNTAEEGKAVENGGADAYYTAIPPFETWRSYLTLNMRGWNICVTKNCKNPERVIRLLEYIMSMEGVKDLYLGVQGEAPENGGDWTGDYVNGPHWYVEPDTGKPTTYPSFQDAKNADWSGMQTKSGLCQFWLAERVLYSRCTGWIRGTEAFERLLDRYSAGTQIANEFNGMYIPNSNAELKELNSELETIQKSYTAKIVFAETEEEANAMYDAMLDEITKAGQATVDAFYTEIYNANLAKIDAE